jgi:orotidine-5'-phosphate decarboxylase
MTKLDQTIIALDFPDQETCLNYLAKLATLTYKPRWLKVGMELYYAAGNDFLKVLKDKGYQIFLDLKLHDIPNTVSSALKSLAKLDVDMLNVHAFGGIEMMKAGAESFKSINPSAKLIAVSVLTSLDDTTLTSELNIQADVKEMVIKLAKNAQLAHLDGLVCSAQEAHLIKNIHQDLITVCPGIRFADDATQDQKRIMTPEKAFANQADFIVVGRSLTKTTQLAQRIEHLTQI